MTKKKILIVDDDQDLRRGLSLRLWANEYDTAFANDASSAISVAQKEKPDLILLDIGLPGGDGFVVMERLKNIASLACVPVIVLSGRDPQITRERALKAGVAVFFQKPADNDELLEAIGWECAKRETDPVKQKILIVDDDQDLRRGINVRLQANHYDTAFAADAITAISVAQKEKPDLILLDIGLPGGDGFVVMSRLRSNASLAGVPVIVLSARDPLINRERALEAGAIAFLEKPVDNEELLVAIREALAGPGGYAQAYM